MEIKEFISQLNDKLTHNSNEIQTIENSEFNFQNTKVYITDYLTGEINSCITKEMFNNVFKEKFNNIGLLPGKEDQQQLIKKLDKNLNGDNENVTQSFEINKDFYICHFASNSNLYVKGSAVKSANLIREIYDSNSVLIDRTELNGRLADLGSNSYFYFDGDDKFIDLPSGSYVIKWSCSVTRTTGYTYTLALPDLYCYPQNTIDLTI